MSPICYIDCDVGLEFFKSKQFSVSWSCESRQRDPNSTVTENIMVIIRRSIVCLKLLYGYVQQNSLILHLRYSKACLLEVADLPPLEDKPCYFPHIRQWCFMMCSVLSKENKYVYTYSAWHESESHKWEADRYHPRSRTRRHATRPLSSGSSNSHRRWLESQSHCVRLRGCLITSNLILLIHTNSIAVYLRSNVYTKHFDNWTKTNAIKTGIHIELLIVWQ